MSEQMSMFDFMEDGEQYKPIKSTDWKWTFADYPKQKNGIKVFSCFACGGGSTMGYKLAGCDVLGCCEIDKQMNDIYVENHHPKFNFLMDIRDFNNLPDSEIPEELFDIDILDGSPPCTTFSISGDREDTWGKAVIPMPLDFGFYNMDCMEGMRQFPDKFFDLAIVDPVYGDVTKGGYMTHNVGQHIGTGKANQKGYHAGLWQQEKTGAEYFEELRRVSKNQIVWGGNYFTDSLPPSQCWIIWDKQHPEGITFADAELAWTSFDAATRIFRFMWNGMLQGNMKDKEFRIHPTQKPVTLYEWIIDKFCKPGDTILDTHVGSGSSLIAAHRRNHKFVGFEIDPTYYETAKVRIENETAQMSMFNYLSSTT